MYLYSLSIRACLDAQKADILGGTPADIPIKAQSLHNAMSLFCSRPLKWNWITFHSTPDIVSGVLWFKNSALYATWHCINFPCLT